VDALTKWIDRYDVCQEYVAVTPDWGVMQSQLSHPVEPLERMSSAFAYARNKYVDDQSLAIYEQASKEKFVMYINQILSLIKLFGPMSQNGGVTPSRAYVSGTQEVKVCPFFVKGDCSRGNYCGMYHDKDHAKHGRMCYICGGRDGTKSGFHRANECPVRKAQMTKGAKGEKGSKGAGKGDQDFRKGP